MCVCVVRDESLRCVCQCTFGVLCVSFNFEGNDVNFSHKIAIRLGYVLDGFELWCVRGAQFEIVPIVGIGFLYQNCKNYLWKLPNHLLSEKWWSIFWSTGVLRPNRPKMVYYCYYVGILFVYEPGDFSGEKFSALRFPILILHKTHTSDNNFQFFRTFFFLDWHKLKMLLPSGTKRRATKQEKQPGYSFRNDHSDLGCDSMRSPISIVPILMGLLGEPALMVAFHDGVHLFCFCNESVSS